MKKQLGAAFLLAGTAIGSGMISLPMVLAKFGVFSSCLIMLLFAGLTYLTALIRSDLNLNSHEEATLKEIGNLLKCQRIGSLGDIFLKILSFALMAAYIWGGASIIHSFSGSMFPFSFVIILFSMGIALVFVCALHVVVHINRILFVAMFCVLFILVMTLFWQSPISFIPAQASNINFRDWTTLVPTIFTSFGFQGSIHSVTKFCKNDRVMVKKACLWGSLIPAFVYIIWTVAILFVVSNTNAEFFQLMLKGEATDVGELVCILSSSSSVKVIQAIVWIVSFLAILTSVFGVGLALLDIFAREWGMPVRKSVFPVVFFPALISLFVPNAFIRILNVSGGVLSVIAIIAPVIMSLKMQEFEKFKGNFMVRNKFLMIFVFGCGVAIIVLGILDLLHSMH